MTQRWKACAAVDGDGSVPKDVRGTHRSWATYLLLCFIAWVFSCSRASLAAAPGDAPPNASAQPAIDLGLTLDWADHFLTVRGRFPGDTIRILYLEAYCRPGSTDRDWQETVIGHQSELIERDVHGQRLRLRDRLEDGVQVEHTITTAGDVVNFELTAHNPTSSESLAHWAQPCMRVGPFTGCTTEDARESLPAYARRCFIVVDGKLTRLPTQPWADRARYTPGQVYCPADINRDDVNPRPLSPLVPSHGLTGCWSADDRMILAIAWQPYQELFQGVITCLHSDFRIGGLLPGESKVIRGKLYLVPNDFPALLTRYERDFKAH